LLVPSAADIKRYVPLPTMGGDGPDLCGHCAPNRCRPCDRVSSDAARHGDKPSKAGSLGRLHASAEQGSAREVEATRDVLTVMYRVLRIGEAGGSKTTVPAKFVIICSMRRRFQSAEIVMMSGAFRQVSVLRDKIGAQLTPPDR